MGAAEQCRGRSTVYPGLVSLWGGLDPPPQLTYNSFGYCDHDCAVPRRG